MKLFSLQLFISLITLSTFSSCHPKKTTTAGNNTTQPGTEHKNPIKVSVIRNLPSELIPGNDYTILVNIKKGTLYGFARFSDILPDGISASEVDSKGGKFTFANQQMKIVWDNVPTDTSFSITYKIHVSENIIGSGEIDGAFSYVENGEPKKTVVGSGNYLITSGTKKDFEKEGYVKATVIFYEVDACKYILQMEPDLNGPDVVKKLEPTNLKEEFKKDQLPVWIKYEIKKGAVSICMAGKIVELSDIQLRK